MTMRVMLGDGAGVVAVLADELLFVARRDNDSIGLIEAFVAAADGGRIDAVTDLLDDGIGALPAMVAIGWRDRIRVVVGGGAEPQTSLAKLASLADRDRDRWAERTLPSGTTLQLRVGEGGTLPCSELGSGVVPAGCIELRLDHTMGEEGLGGVEPPVATRQRPEPAADARTPLPDPPPAPVKTPAPAPTLDWDGSFDHPMDDPASSTVVPAAAETSIGRIRFEDGRTEPLDQPLVIGRSPTLESVTSGARCVPWEVPSVSKTHVEVRPAGAGAEVIDLGSRNGTYLVELSATELIELEPHVPRLIQPGDQVLIGENQFVYEVVMT